jgi:hypothetical protein
MSCYGTMVKGGGGGKKRKKEKTKKRERRRRKGKKREEEGKNIYCKICPKQDPYGMKICALKKQFLVHLIL